MTWAAAATLPCIRKPGARNPVVGDHRCGRLADDYRGEQVAARKSKSCRGYDRRGRDRPTSGGSCARELPATPNANEQRQENHIQGYGGPERI